MTATTNETTAGCSCGPDCPCGCQDGGPCTCSCADDCCAGAAA